MKYLCCVYAPPFLVMFHCAMFMVIIIIIIIMRRRRRWWWWNENMIWICETNTINEVILILIICGLNVLVLSLLLSQTGKSCFPSYRCYHDCGIHGDCQVVDYKCHCHLGWMGENCTIDCGCNGHSWCTNGIGVCDKCQGRLLSYCWWIKEDCEF